MLRTILISTVASVCVALFVPLAFGTTTGDVVITAETPQQKITD